MACVPFLAWVLGRSSRGRSPMRCYSVSRNTRSGSWRWWSDASTSGSSPTGTTRTPCPDSSKRPRSSPVRSSSQCWQFSRYFLDNQTIYPRTPNFVWLSWISVSKNNFKFMYFIHWPTAKVGFIFYEQRRHRNSPVRSSSQHWLCFQASWWSHNH